MIENNLYSKFDYNKVLTAKVPKVQQKITPNIQNKKDEFVKKKINNSKIISILAILGLAGVAFAILKYNNKGLSFLNSSKFDRAYSELKPESKNKIINQKQVLNKHSLRFANEPISNFDIFKDLISAENTGEKIGKYSVPDVVFLSGAGSKKDNFQELFADYFNCETKMFEYPKGKLNEFLEYLKTFKAKTTDDTSKRTFIGIKNFQDLLAEIEERGKESEKLIFSDFIKNCSKENKITIFLDELDSQGLKKYSANAIKIDLSRYSLRDLEHDNLVLEVSKFQDFKNLIKNMKMRPVYCSDDSLYDLFKNGKINIILNGISENNRGSFLEELSRLFHCKQTIFDMKEKTIDDLAQFAKKYKNDFEIGKEDVILYLQNLDEFLSKNADKSSEISKLRDFLNSSFENYGTRIIYDDFDDLPEELSKIPSGLRKLQFVSSLDIFSKKRQEMLDLMAQNDFSIFPGNAMGSIKGFIDGLALEQAGEVAKEELFNNILLYGESEKTLNDGMHAIMNTLDTYKHTVNFDVKNPMVSISQIVEIIKEGDEEFQKTGKRTLLFVKNLDELLVDDSTIEKRGFIGRMKGTLENSSKNHTNIIMTTIKPLSSFENASVAPHRFGLKILL